MMVSCSKCSKSLKVKDEWAGKMIKCPQCGSTFRADATGKASAASPPTATKAASKPASGKPIPMHKGKVPAPKRAGIAINWGMLVMIGLASLIPIGIILFFMGPMRVKKHWEANSAKADTDVTTVVEHAMKCYESNEGSWNPKKSGGMPSVGDLVSSYPWAFADAGLAAVVLGLLLFWVK